MYVEWTSKFHRSAVLQVSAVALWFALGGLVSIVAVLLVLLY